MTKMKINEAARTIEMTKMFYRAACQFGTEEYKMLQEARRDYPGFTTSIAQPKKNSKAPNEAYKGLDYKYILNQRNECGRRYAWRRPLKEQLIECGYSIADGRKNNRRYSLITQFE